MAYKEFGDHNFSETGGEGSAPMTFQAGAGDLNLPGSSFIRDAEFGREGMDLTLDGPDGAFVVENYFGVEDAPDLIAPDGLVLTPGLVDSFLQGGDHYAANATMSDESPVGAVSEISGSATVTRLDGSSEPLTLGMPIYEGDVLETGGGGAVNITFVDETSFAVSENARLAIDEYVYDPATESGATDFSVLKGMFVFTSGLIGRNDPDDVTIDTPAGSIGIRGTIIAGDVDQGEITVVEGAIVVRDFSGNEMTLANQFETARFNSADGQIDHMGQRSAADMSQKFAGVSKVAPTLFSSINDAAAEQSGNEAGQDAADAEAASEDAAAEDVKADENPAEDAAAQDGEPGEPGEPGEQAETKPDAEGSVDKNADNQVDGTVAEGKPAGEGQPPAAEGPRVGPAGMQQGGLEAPNMMQARPAAPRPAPSQTLPAEKTVLATDAEVRALDGAKDDGHLADGDQAGNTTNEPLPPPTNTADTNARPQYHGATHLVFDSSDNAYDSPAFAFSENTSGTFHPQFVYAFDKLFHDPDGAAGVSATDLTFSLSDTSVTKLNALTLDSGVDILDSWSFSSSNGMLTLNINDSFNFTGGEFDFNLKVIATDVGGKATAATFEFDVYEEEAVSVHNVTNSTHTISSDSGDVFFFNDNASLSTITLGAAADDNELHLGRGDSDSNTLDNKVIIESGSIGHVIVGSDNPSDTDLYEVRDAANEIYGMDGKDTFKVDIESGSAFLSTAATAGSAGVFDGGHGDFDTIELFSSHSSVSQMIDFSLLDGAQFKNIEIIDASHAKKQTIKLSYEDVIDMTDADHTLKIHLGTDDTLDVDLANEFSDTGTDVTEDGVTYDVFRSTSSLGETVTLLVDQSDTGASVV